MATPRTEVAAEAWGTLLQVHAALVPELDRRLRTGTGLPLAWYDVLLELSAARDGRLTMGRVGERGGLQPEPGQPGRGRAHEGRPGAPGGQRGGREVGVRRDHACRAVPVPRGRAGL